MKGTAVSSGWQAARVTVSDFLFKILKWTLMSQSFRFQIRLFSLPRGHFLQQFFQSYITDPTWPFQGPFCQKKASGLIGSGRFSWCMFNWKSPHSAIHVGGSSFLYFAHYPYQGYLYKQGHPDLRHKGFTIFVYTNISLECIVNRVKHSLDFAWTCSKDFMSKKLSYFNNQV